MNIWIETRKRPWWWFGKVYFICTDYRDFPDIGPYLWRSHARSDANDLLRYPGVVEVLSRP